VPDDSYFIILLPWLLLSNVIKSFMWVQHGQTG